MKKFAEKERELLVQVLKNDLSAVAFCEQIFYISQIWDDMIDGDNEVPAHELNRVMWTALIEIPMNSFYQEHMFALQPTLKVFILDWLDANVLEKQEDEHSKNVAFVLRDGIAGLVGQCAYLIGGFDWMTSVSPLVRQFAHDESLEDYKAKLSPAKVSEEDDVVPTDSD